MCTVNFLPPFCKSTYLTPRSVLQKKVIRAIPFKNLSASSTPIFLTLQSLKLKDLFEMKLLTFVFESVNKYSHLVSMIILMYFHKFINMIPDKHIKVTFV